MSKEIEKIIKSVLTESYKRFEKRLKHHTESLIEVLDEKFKIVKEQFIGVHEKLDEHTRILNSHTEQIGNILVDLSTIKINVANINYDVRVKLDNKADKKHFVDLDGRIRRLEKK